MWRGGHLLERGGEHRAHGDVTWAVLVGDQHLGVAVCAQAQAQARVLDGLEAGRLHGLQIFLAQVHAVCTGFDGRLPMVVDEQAGAGALHTRHRGHHLGADRSGIGRLEAQLHRGHTGLGHPDGPGCIGHDRVQPQRRRARRERVGARPRGHAEIGGLCGPLLGMEFTGAKRLPRPGLSHAQRIGRYKAQLVSGQQGCGKHQVARIAPQGVRLRAHRQRQRRLVGAHDGLRHRLDVHGLVQLGVSGDDHGWCQKGVPSTGVLGWALSCCCMAPER